MSRKDPPGDKDDLFGSIRRTSDRVKRWVRSPSRPPSQSTKHAGEQLLLSSLAVYSAVNDSRSSSHLLAPNPLGTHKRAASAPDLTSSANPPPGPAGGHISSISQQDIMKEVNIGPAWLGLKTALGGLYETAKLFPSLHSAIGSFLSGFDHFQTVAKNRQDYDQLASDLEALVTLLDQHLCKSESTTLSDCVVNAVKTLGVEMEKAGKRIEQSTAAGVMQAREDEAALIESYQRITNIFRRLEADASLSIWSVVNEHLARTRLNSTQPAELAAFNAALPADIVRRTCTENTRTTILSNLDTWSCDPSLAKVYWMNGMAGTGKTTIACSLCRALEERKQLGASFFCTRTLPECRDARRIVPTLAYQLAQYSRPFKSALCKVLEVDADVRTRNVQTQLDRMLKEPLLAVRDAIPDNIVITIDALDECDSSAHARELINGLIRLASDLPLKFFITSRPEPGITSRIMSQNANIRTILQLHEIERSLVQADIELYLTEELSSISPSTAELQQLAELAGCLFIYAAAAARYIIPVESGAFVNSRQRLQTIVTGMSGSKQQHAELDALYMTVLKGALNESLLEPEEFERGCRVVWAAASVCEPVSTKTLSKIADVSTEETEMILQSLQSVLRVSRDLGLVSTLHASFPDFITTPGRSQQFGFGSKNTQYIATRCFDIMQTELRFNIRSLESSFLLDKWIPDLDQRVVAHISGPLSYACRYWGHHLSLVNLSENLRAMLEEFLTYRLLFWMEVLNLTGSGVLGVTLLYHVQQWLLMQGPSSYLTQLLSDAKLFVSAFVLNPVANSTPHIYVSALPFWHSSSLVYSLYQGRMQGLVNVGGTALDNRLGNDAKWSTGVKIKAISASPISNFVAFGGCDDEDQGVIGVLNYHSGVYALPVFKGHDKPVTSVAFSPDGSYIASASNDHTICVWNTLGAKRSGKPFRGHTDAVSSVAFSPDGALLVSGSNDTTVRVWMLQDGNPAIEPFEGHTDVVSCIDFSPDGARVVSGSHDKTIRVWSIPDQSCVAGPFQVVDNLWVRSVALSSDGLRVAVGFNGGLSMWDIQIGTPVPEFFQGHDQQTASVAFSPDYTRIVSSSEWTPGIFTWDSRTGKLLSQVDLHSDYVYCIALSSDGAYVLSSSDDTTISVWPAYGLNQTTETPQGAPSPVTCITFSADGSRFASRSDDGSIYVWAIHDGRLIVGPLKVHGAYIMAVAFSPD